MTDTRTLAREYANQYGRGNDQRRVAIEAFTAGWRACIQGYRPALQVSADTVGPLDVLNLENDPHPNFPSVIVLMRDWRDPAWLTIEADSAQILRVHDSIEWRYFRIGHVGTDKWPTVRFIDLLRRASW